MQCRTWPFWAEVVESSEAWDDAAKEWATQYIYCKQEPFIYRKQEPYRLQTRVLWATIYIYSKQEPYDRDLLAQCKKSPMNAKRAIWMQKEWATRYIYRKQEPYKRDLFPQNEPNECQKSPWTRKQPDRRSWIEWWCGKRAQWMQKEPYERGKSSMISKRALWTRKEPDRRGWFEWWRGKKAQWMQKEPYEREKSPIQQIESRDDAAKEPNECKKSPLNAKRARYNKLNRVRLGKTRRKSKKHSQTTAL